MDGYSGRCGPRRPVHRGGRPHSTACVREGTQLLGCLRRQTTWRHGVSSFRDKVFPLDDAFVPSLAPTPVTLPRSSNSPFSLLFLATRAHQQLRLEPSHRLRPRAKALTHRSPTPSRSSPSTTERRRDRAPSWPASPRASPLPLLALLKSWWVPGARTPSGLRSTLSWWPAFARPRRPSAVPGVVEARLEENGWKGGLRVREEPGKPARLAAEAGSSLALSLSSPEWRREEGDASDGRDPPVSGFRRGAEPARDAGRLPGRLGPCPSGPSARQCCFSFSLFD